MESRRGTKFPGYVEAQHPCHHTKFFSFPTLFPTLHLQKKVSFFVLAAAIAPKRALSIGTRLGIFYRVVVDPGHPVDPGGAGFRYPNPAPPHPVTKSSFAIALNPLIKWR